MSRPPRVSFLVPSYNYERYVGETVRSILSQTSGDLEVVVVDDCSTDRSCEVVRAIGDDRVRLYVNDRNMGGSFTYNRALSLARGEFVVNLDSDDVIHPRKTERQLEAFAADPALDVVATHTAFIDANGAPHPDSEDLDAYSNRPFDYNVVDTWVVQNMVCRSSTMLRREAAVRIGGSDLTMVRAPDFELWTRALRLGCRFGLVQEKLTSLRLHGKGVTHGDPRRTFREICYLLLRNVVPIVEARATWPTLARALDWIVTHEQFAWLEPAERYRLLGMLLCRAAPQDYAGFDRALASDGDPALLDAGRRCLALSTVSPGAAAAQKLARDVDLVGAAREFWRTQADNWQREYAWWHDEALRHRAEAEYWRAEAARLGALPRVARVPMRLLSGVRARLQGRRRTPPGNGS